MFLLLRAGAGNAGALAFIPKGREDDAELPPVGAAVARIMSW